MKSIRIALHLLFVVAAALAACAPGSAETPGTYRAAIEALPCRYDEKVEPTVALSQSIAKPTAWRAISVRESYQNGWWRIETALTRAHKYVWITSEHCAAHVAAVSLTGQQRAFVVALGPGTSTNLDERDAFIAGTLPFPGVASVDLVSPQTNTQPEMALRQARIEGRDFYIENVPPGNYAVKVTLVNGGVAYFPAITVDRRHPFKPFALIMNISDDQLRTAIRALP